MMTGIRMDRLPQIRLPFWAAVATMAALLLALLALPARAETPEAKKQYATLAEAVATPVFTKSADAGDSQTDTAVMLRAELARQQLTNLTGLPADLAAARTKMLEKLSKLHNSMENLRRLDKYTPDIEGIVSKALDAAPAAAKSADKRELNDDDNRAVNQLAAKLASELVSGAVHAYQAREERDDYRKTYSQLRSLAVKEMLKCRDTRYKDVTESVTGSVKVELLGSWNATWSRDLPSFQNNSGKTLHHCTIFVNVIGYNAKTGARETDCHLHYMGSWPAGSWIHAAYPSKTHSGIATDQSADSIERLEVFTYSDELRDTTKYTYEGKDYDADVEQYFDKIVKPKFTGGWYYYPPDDLFYNSGFYVWFDSKTWRFPVTHVTVRVKQGNQSFAIRWSISDQYWEPGSKKWFSDARFNQFDKPDEVKLVLEFPCSSVTRELTWNLKK